MNVEQIALKDIPTEVMEGIMLDIKPYITPIILVSENNGKISAECIGTGTFVESNGKYGILTAHHVVHNSRFNSCSSIGLCIKDYANPYSIKREAIQIIDVGVPITESKGPDLSVMLLDNIFASQIKVSMSFWNLNHHSQSMESLKDFTIKGACSLFGFPEELIETTIEKSKNKETLTPIGLSGLIGIDKYWRDSEFDFVIVSVSYDEQSNSPKSFGGVSGAGLWHFDLIRDVEFEMKHTRPLLIGLAFYQSPRENDLRYLTCHGIESIYKNVVNALDSL